MQTEKQQQQQHLFSWHCAWKREKAIDGSRTCGYRLLLNVVKGMAGIGKKY